jgi:hypothetical protein
MNIPFISTAYSQWHVLPFTLQKKISHSYKTRFKIIHLYVLMFDILESRQGKRFWTEWQASPKSELLLIDILRNFHLLF